MAGFPAPGACSPKDEPTHAFIDAISVLELDLRRALERKTVLDDDGLQMYADDCMWTRYSIDQRKTVEGDWTECAGRETKSCTTDATS